MTSKTRGVAGNETLGGPRVVMMTSVEVGGMSEELLTICGSVQKIGLENGPHIISTAHSEQCSRRSSGLIWFW